MLLLFRKGKSMKKIAIAAALAALATTVNAQGVSIYGIMDTAIQNYDAGTTTITRAGDNLLATSRLGFRGTEDLGGGLKANFQLEGKLTPSTGTFGSSTTNQMFDREAWVGISGGFGDIRMGRQDVSYAQDIDTGLSQAGNFGNFAVNGTDFQLGADQSSVIKYTTPTLGGFTAQVGRATNAAGATTDAQADQTSAHVKFEKGALRLHAGYQKTDGATAAAERDFTAYGVSYDLGPVAVSYVRGEGDVSTTGTVKSKGQVASVKVPLSNGFAAHGVYATTKDGSQAANGEGKGYTVALTKAMSKRTTLYAAYTAVDNEASSSMAMTGVTAPASAGLDTRATTVGISHVF